MVLLVVVRSVLEGSGEIDVGISEESMLGCVGASTSAMVEQLTKMKIKMWVVVLKQEVKKRRVQ